MVNPTDFLNYGQSGQI